MNDFEIALYCPQIPPNTGNIVRLCVNLNIKLHLIAPLGFNIDEKSIRRAGLDYWKDAKITTHKNYESFIKSEGSTKHIFLITKFAKQTIYSADLNGEQIFLFGNETSGVPKKIHESYKNDSLLIPMPGNTRSLNLSNAVAVVAYECYRRSLIN